MDMQVSVDIDKEIDFMIAEQIMTTFDCENRKK
jgi:hypothetical protein